MLTFSAVARDRKDPLEKERQMVERRRHEHAERMKRLNDPKARKLAIDPSEIAAQIAEKKSRVEAERARQLAMDAETIGHVGLLEQADRQRAEARKKAALANAAYLKTQHREDADTWDINNPSRVRTEQPPRLADPMSAAPVSSMQHFVGEDPSIGKRIQAQRNQIRQWANAIVQEKEKARESEKAADNEAHQFASTISANAQQMEVQKIQLRSNMIYSVAESNRVESERKAQVNAAKAESAKQAVCQSGPWSDLLSENRETTIRVDNKNRYIPYHFKGISTEERQKFLDAQKAQVQEKAERKREEMEWM